MKSRRGLVAFGIAIALIAVCLSSRLGINALLLLTDGGSGGYFVPKESSLFTFSATEMNQGSGGWWLRGEDGNNLYAVVGSEPGYVVFPKVATARCHGFVETDPKSWCSENRRRSQQ